MTLLIYIEVCKDQGGFGVRLCGLLWPLIMTFKIPQTSQTKRLLYLFKRWLFLEIAKKTKTINLLQSANTVYNSILSSFGGLFPTSDFPVLGYNRHINSGDHNNRLRVTCFQHDPARRGRHLGRYNSTKMNFTSDYSLGQDMALAAEVQKHPCLYNRNVPGYKKEEHRSQAWAAIGEALGVDKGKSCLSLIFARDAQTHF